MGSLPSESIKSRVGAAWPMAPLMVIDPCCTRSTAGAIRDPAARKIPRVGIAFDASLMRN